MVSTNLLDGGPRRTEKVIITKTDYVNFVERNANAAGVRVCACDEYELCMYARFFVLEQGQLFEQDLYFFYLFIIIIIIIIIIFFFGNNHGRLCACVIIICVRPQSLSRVGQWSGVQQVNKLDA
jgi:hypothetical protein